MAYKCEYINKIRIKYENWPEECWPDMLFTESDYPCRTCPKQKERYVAYLKESIERAKKNKDSNYHLITKLAYKHGGQYVITGYKDGNPTYGMLVGVTSTLEDYYWVYLNSDLKCSYDTCVSKLNLIDYIPASCSVLNYLSEHQPKELIKKVKDFVNASEYDILITPIYVTEKRYGSKYNSKVNGMSTVVSNGR